MPACGAPRATAHRRRWRGWDEILPTTRRLSWAVSAVTHELVFGAPGVGKTHLAIALGRAVVEAGHSVLFTSATAPLAALSKAETDGEISDQDRFPRQNSSAGQEHNVDCLHKTKVGCLHNES